MESHLLQMRGLKLPTSDERRCRAAASHLLQMRGLKPSLLHVSFSYRLSHLLQMRGLKLGHITDILLVSRRIFYRCVD